MIHILIQREAVSVISFTPNVYKDIKIYKYEYIKEKETDPKL